MAGAVLNVDKLLGVMDTVLKTTTGKGINAMIDEHDKEEEAEDASLDILAEKITKRIKLGTNSPLPTSLMLVEPLSLTVSKEKGNYAKRPHVGGEEFTPIRCYAGKRNALIYVFRPISTADYVEMEMTEAQAKKSLSGFETWLKTVIDPELDRTRKEAQNAASMKTEREKLASHAEKYGEEFASW